MFPYPNDMQIPGTRVLVVGGTGLSASELQQFCSLSAWFRSLTSAAKLLLLKGIVVVNHLAKSIFSIRSSLAFALALSLTPAVAETNAVPLADYLGSMDRAEILFSGQIRYDRAEDSFKFYDENREPFGVTVDAGRDARERIETECEYSSFFVTDSDLCTISGSGTVEIRGSRIYISIETVEHVGK